RVSGREARCGCALRMGAWAAGDSDGRAADRPDRERLGDRARLDSASLDPTVRLPAINSAPLDPTVRLARICRAEVPSAPVVAPLVVVDYLHSSLAQRVEACRVAVRLPVIDARDVGVD